MNRWIHKCAALLVTASALTLTLEAAAEEKVQKITFIEDDAQKNMASKIYVLKYTKAADIAPFIRGAAKRYCKESHISTVTDVERNRELLVVSTGIKNIKYIDALVEALDRNAKFDQYSNITGNGIAVGFYQPTYRSTQSMLDVIVKSASASGPEDATVAFDAKRNMFYFKDTPFKVANIKSKLEWLDKPIPQSRVVLTVYEVRDSDLKDIGIDYLAWKNGPGMNLFNVGYSAFSGRIAEKLISSAADGLELLANSTWGFGGFYTAPAFDMSFVRLLQQNGKAAISSTAYVTVSNVPEKTFSVSFAPEYQNITKDDDHITSVAVGGDSSLTAVISDAVITAGKNGTVNFNYVIDNKNVVERNNMGAEITESETVKASTSLAYDQEKVLAVWVRSSQVKQTIGVPVLCELPILKYIFGTTTEQTELTRCIVTARAVPVVYNENMEPGTVAEFEKVCKK